MLIFLAVREEQERCGTLLWPEGIVVTGPDGPPQRRTIRAVPAGGQAPDDPAVILALMAQLRRDDGRQRDGTRPRLKAVRDCGRLLEFEFVGARVMPEVRIDGHLPDSDLAAAISEGLRIKPPGDEADVSAITRRLRSILGHEAIAEIGVAECPDCPETVTVRRPPVEPEFSLQISNDSTVFVGRERAVVTGELGNLLVAGDQLDLAAVQSLERGQAFFSWGGYQTPLFGSDVEVFYQFFRSQIEPGAAFLRDIEFKIDGQSDRIGVVLPKVPVPGGDIAWTVDMVRDDFRLRRNDSLELRDVNWSLGLAADLEIRFHDRLSTDIGGGLRRGVLVSDGTKPGSDARTINTLSPHTWTYSLDTEVDWRLSSAWSATGRLFLQEASEQIGQQCEYGGTGIGRGYDPLEASGDNCILAMIELARDPDAWQVGAFTVEPFVSADYGRLSLNAGPVGPAVAGVQTDFERSSVAVGVRASLGGQLEVDLLAGLPLQKSGLPDGFGDTARFLFSVRVAN